MILYVIQYEDKDGNCRRRWYPNNVEAKRGYKYFRKVEKVGKAKDIYPPMKEKAPPREAMPTKKEELITWLNENETFDNPT